MMWLCDYNEDLTNIKKSKYDIVKVSNVIGEMRILPSYWTEEALDETIMWERREPQNDDEIKRLKSAANDVFDKLESICKNNQ
jgi:hypothetical protein